MERVDGELRLGLDQLDPTSGGQRRSAARLTLALDAPPIRFYRHGWQSWTLTTWLDPAQPPMPIRAAEFRAKDEDPQYAFAKNHTSAWIGAVEIRSGDIVLLGGVDLGARVELDGAELKGFYETGQGDWFLARGPEDRVFSEYAGVLKSRFGASARTAAPRVWCSWYSLYKWINESSILRTLGGIRDLPFDVFQLDDGWQVSAGDWESNSKFPSGMESLASKIRATGRAAGLWLAPLMVTRNSSIFRDHPDWLLRDNAGQPAPVGLTWEGNPHALDCTHPAVLEWLERLIRRIRSWGFEYLKLDFLCAGAFPGRRFKDMPRESAYRDALKVIRAAAGDAYILACGAPILPSLGLVDGIRIGPDVGPFWLNKPLSVWLNNPNDPCAQNAIRTSLHRLWLKPLIHIDPDVVYFRSRYSSLKPAERQLLADLGMLAEFKATSDLPQWLDVRETEVLRHYLEATPHVQKLGRYDFAINGRHADFTAAIPLYPHGRAPVWLARNLGFLKIAIYQVLPAIWESRRHPKAVAATVIAFLQTMSPSWLP